MALENKTSTNDGAWIVGQHGSPRLVEMLFAGNTDEWEHPTPACKLLCRDISKKYMCFVYVDHLLEGTLFVEEEADLHPHARHRVHTKVVIQSVGCYISFPA